MLVICHLNIYLTEAVVMHEAGDVYSYFFHWSLHGAAVAKWTAMQQPGVRFPVGTVYLPSFTSFARDRKWGCCL